ncbi:hypothetical protein F5Y04DRAFT_195147 [Hypomontagnella monticulosa]|nr:hypothetical protein F5Y04DRAFT_195147 [Hypomontagnella monticulosa]
MVFPSRGCITCKRRRIKCDSVHPICGRCLKASRACAWEQNEQAGLLFVSENAFAQGKPRRPWKPRERDSVTTEATDLLAEVELSPASPPIFLDDGTIKSWMENYVSRDSEMPESAREYGCYLRVYWDSLRHNSSLHLAASAVASTVLGYTTRDNNMIQNAAALFAESVTRMQIEVQQLSQDNIDELLITTMLVADYEEITYRDGRNQSREDSPSSAPNHDVIGSQFWEDNIYHEDAAGLLGLRQQRGWAPSPGLDSAVRRKVIRAYVLRGLLVDEWLQDGAQFGEEGPVLDLDSIIVRVANLRARSLCLFLPKSGRFSDQPHPGDLAIEARNLDLALEFWSRNIPDDWKFSTQPDSTPYATFDGLVYVHATYDQGAIWNQYRALRIIVNSIRKRALAVMAQCAAQAVFVNAERGVCLEMIASIATELCRSMPFFSPNHTAPGLASTITETRESNYEIPPKLAPLLAWPLVLAISTDDVPEPQKQWLKNKLKSIANILGNSFLTTVIEQGGFKF